MMTSIAAVVPVQAAPRVPTQVTAQGAALPAAPAEGTKALHRIDGFRSARFGMSLADVLRALASDFKDYAVLARQIENPVDKTQVLVLPLAALEPGPGPASVSYIFGAKSHKLIQVNVLWTTRAKAGAAERERLVAAGVQLSSYFQQQSWRPNAASMGMAAGPETVILFAGIDANKAMVEVSLSGIPVRGKDGAASAEPAVQDGQARLRVAYVATIMGPDAGTPAAPKQ